MESKMKLWECTYKVTRQNDYFLWRDYIWSTSKPIGNSIGHYFRVGFNYTISEGQSKLAPSGLTEKDITPHHITESQMIK